MSQTENDVGGAFFTGVIVTFVACLILLLFYNVGSHQTASNITEQCDNLHSFAFASKVYTCEVK